MSLVGEDGLILGYVPPRAPFFEHPCLGELGTPDTFLPNVDRSGMPLDFETYEWMVYGDGRNLSPGRSAYLYGRYPHPSRPNPMRTTRR